MSSGRKCLHGFFIEERIKITISLHSKPLSLLTNLWFSWIEKESSSLLENEVFIVEESGASRNYAWSWIFWFSCLQMYSVSFDDLVRVYLIEDPMHLLETGLLNPYTSFCKDKVRFWGLDTFQSRLHLSWACTSLGFMIWIFPI